MFILEVLSVLVLDCYKCIAFIKYRKLGEFEKCLYGSILNSNTELMIIRLGIVANVSNLKLKGQYLLFYFIPLKHIHCIICCIFLMKLQTTASELGISNLINLV